MGRLQAEQTTHSTWKVPRLHFIIAPAMGLPQAVHLSACLSVKQALQYGARECTLKGFPESCIEQPAHWKHAAWSLPPSCSMSTTFPPRMGSLQTWQLPKAHCVV